MTSNLCFSQHVGGGSIDWHSLQFWIRAFTDPLEFVGSTSLTKYNVFLMPGWPLWLWMNFIHSELGLLVDVAHTWFCGSVVFLIKSNHHCNTYVRPTAQLCSDFTKVMSIANSYSSMKFVSAPSHRFTCHFGIYPSLSCKGICDPFIYTGSSGKEMQHCYFLYQWKVKTFKHSIKLYQNFVLHIFLFPK